MLGAESTQSPAQPSPHSPILINELFLPVLTLILTPAHTFQLCSPTPDNNTLDLLHGSNAVVVVNDGSITLVPAHDAVTTVWKKSPRVKEVREEA